MPRIASFSSRPVEALRAAVAATTEAPGDEMSELLRRRYEVLLRRAKEHAEAARVPRGNSGNDGRPLDVGSDTVRTATAAARRRLLSARDDHTIDDAAFQRVEQELDWEELDFEQPTLGHEGDSAR